MERQTVAESHIEHGAPLGHQSWVNLVTKMNMKHPVLTGEKCK